MISAIISSLSSIGVSAFAICVALPKELLFCAFGCFGDHVIDAAVRTGGVAVGAVDAALVMVVVDHSFRRPFSESLMIRAISAM